MDWQQYQTEFLASFRTAGKDSLEKRLNLAFEADISYYFELSAIQDPFRFRARHVGMTAACLLIDEKGELQRDLLSQIVKQLQQGFFSLGPRREGDSLIYSHLLDCLQEMEKEKEVWNLIRKLSPPLCHRRAEEVIKETLWPESIRKVETFHIRRAALAGWLTLLRQTTGSCFATAPAGLIQKKPIQFFKDINELLSIGQLKRVVGGKQYAVPMCPSIGSIELGKPIASADQLAFSPGLIAGLVSAQMLPAAEPMIDKARRLALALQGLEEIKTPEQVLRDLTMKSVGIEEKDVEDEEYLLRIQIGPMMAREGAVFYQRPSLRGQKVSDWKKRFQSARMAFQSLTDCVLLRVWEYTIASFCDVKTDFAKWNLYASLGMRTEQKGGIADFLYRRIDRMLKEANEEILKLQSQYERAIYAVHSLEALFHRSSDSQRYELQGQMSGAVHEANVALDERNRWARKAEAIAGFFSTLMQHYDTKLQEYFQEVFDPSVSQKEEELFEDSPAGFRLLFKHGRADASTWELIYDKDAYLQSLRSFFSAIEGDVALPPSLEKNLVSAITTELIQFIQEPEFLEEAQQRSESIGRKSPWDYVSGGTMQSLVQSYYGRSQPLSEVSFLPRSEMELLRFLDKIQGKKNLLMHSPAHAFVLRLDLFPEKANEKAEANMAAARKWKCGEEKQEYIGHSFSEKLSHAERAIFLHRFRQQKIAETPMQLRQSLLETVQTMRNKADLSGMVDSHLYEQTFLIAGDAIAEALKAIFEPWPNKFTSQAITRVGKSFMGPFELHQTAKAILLEGFKTSSTPVDWDERIASQICRLGFSLTHLILFADTNWSGWFFGFVANAFTGQMELWRLNRIGTKGYPMNDWKQWFSSENKMPWTLLNRPDEYN